MGGVNKVNEEVRGGSRGGEKAGRGVGRRNGRNKVLVAYGEGCEGRGVGDRKEKGYFASLGWIDLSYTTFDLCRFSGKEERRLKHP